MAAQERVICRAADLLDGGSGVRFNVLVHGREEPAFVIRFRGRVHAYFNRCSHVPVELDCRPGEFFDDSKLYLICSMHGALYAPESGCCLGGRCQGRGLIPVAVEERDDFVFLIPNE